MIRFRLEAERVVPLPGRSPIYRWCRVRRGLIEPEARRRKKADYKRWERSRAMELWQMDIFGGVRLVNGWKASIVSGVEMLVRKEYTAEYQLTSSAAGIGSLLPSSRARQLYSASAAVITAGNKLEPRPVVGRECDHGPDELLTDHASWQYPRALTELG